MKTSLRFILLGGLLLAVGCKGPAQQDTDESYLSKFVPDGEPRRVQEIAAAQVASGAREDGMLYAWDFDGKDLSPLGREKLGEIADADSMEPLAIHLDVNPDTFADRKASVVAYLQDKGIATSHLAITQGVNESTYSPAAAGLAGYAKTDTAEQASAGSSANSNTASASAK